MRAYVQFRLPDDTLREVDPGGVIGRLAGAALSLDDPRISEAHALVSLRGDQLRLFALRGRFAIEGRAREEVELRPGLRIALARDLVIEVEAVRLPEAALALRGPGFPTQLLPGSCSLVFEPEPSLVARARGQAEAWFWSNGESWRVRLRDAPARVLAAGDQLTVRGRVFEAVLAPLQPITPTRLDGAAARPLHLVASYEAVHVQRAGVLVLSLAGVPARLLTELAVAGVPVPWETVAAEVWGAHDRLVLRRRLDPALSRLRGRLRDAGLRADLLRLDGHGNLELLLHPGDTVEDRS